MSSVPKFWNYETVLQITVDLHRTSCGRVCCNGRQGAAAVLRRARRKFGGSVFNAYSSPERYHSGLDSDFITPIKKTIILLNWPKNYSRGRSRADRAEGDAWSTSCTVFGQLGVVQQAISIQSRFGGGSTIYVMALYPIWITVSVICAPFFILYVAARNVYYKVQWTANDIYPCYVRTTLFSKTSISVLILSDQPLSVPAPPCYQAKLVPAAATEERVPLGYHENGRGRVGVLWSAHPTGMHRLYNLNM